MAVNGGPFPPFPSTKTRRFGLENIRANLTMEGFGWGAAGHTLGARRRAACAQIRTRSLSSEFQGQREEQTSLQKSHQQPGDELLGPKHDSLLIMELRCV